MLEMSIAIRDINPDCGGAALEKISQKILRLIGKTMHLIGKNVI